MFKKAVKDHCTNTTKPLQSKLLQDNVDSQSKQPPPPPPQSIGVKRKIEMASTGESGLGSLHNAVYFDENDFDDDDDIDFEEPGPPVPGHNVALPEQPVINRSSRQSSLPSKKESPVDDNVSPDIQYPELPPVPEGDGGPPSSIQFPWSSSPPSHFQGPPNPRTVPWLKKEEPRPKETTNPVTPARPKPTVPWMKTESAIKQEQKELRRLSKKDQKADTASKSNGPVPKLAAVFLSDEQRHVLDAVVQNGKSIFFTGSAGTGKSVLMREIIKNLRNKYRKEPDRVAVTASTGLAACNIEGVTLHSFAGIGLGKEPVPELVKKVMIFLVQK